MTPSRSLSLTVFTVFLASSAAAQVATTPPAATPAVASETGTVEGGTPKYYRDETPEQRTARIGTTEDPGPNPDPEKVFSRFGKNFKIEKYELRWAVFTPDHPGQVRPFGFANIYREIYQQNDLYIWVWKALDDEQPDPSTLSPEEQPVDETKYRRYANETYAIFQTMRSDFSPKSVPASSKTIRFVESSEGLPTDGSWRNSMAVADMNGDGKLDVIVPPERTGNGIPAIFLGDGTGKWKYWEAAEWPGRLDYGSVEAADFNRDGKMDLAFGVHLTGIRVFLGNGAGKFTDSSSGLPTDYPTRRIRIADVNNDGLPDVVAISEGVTIATGTINHSKLRAYLNENRGTSWKRQDVIDASVALGGDYLAVGNFNADKQVDFVASSGFMNATQLVQVSDGPLRWSARGAEKAILYQSVYFANAAGRFTGGKQDEAIVTYMRSWPTRIDPKIVPEPALRNVSGIDFLKFDAKGQPTRTQLARWGGESPVVGIAPADYDLDGNLDFAIQRLQPKRSIEIYLGNGKGGFTVATIEGVTLPTNPSYDLKVADVNGDKRPDLLVMFESSGTTRFAAKDGAIRVFLNDGTSRAASAAR